MRRADARSGGATRASGGDPAGGARLSSPPGAQRARPGAMLSRVQVPLRRGATRASAGCRRGLPHPLLCDTVPHMRRRNRGEMTVWRGGSGDSTTTISPVNLVAAPVGRHGQEVGVADRRLHILHGRHGYHREATQIPCRRAHRGRRACNGPAPRKLPSLRGFGVAESVMRGVRRGATRASAPAVATLGASRASGVTGGASSLGRRERVNLSLRGRHGNGA